MTGVMIVRHGQSTWNADGRWQGWADPPLSGLGRDQARQAGMALAPAGAAEGLDVVVTSDLRRARDTADILSRAAGLAGRVEIEPALREYDVGEWGGLTREEIERGWPDMLASWDRGELPGAPGAETRRQFEARVAGAAQRVAEAYPAPLRVLVVTHGGVIRSLARAAGCPERRVENLGGYRACRSAGNLSPTTPVDLLGRLPSPS